MAAILDFQIPLILTADELHSFHMHQRVAVPICIIMPNFIEIGQAVVEISQFSRWQPAVILIFKFQKILMAGDVHSAKFYQNRSNGC